MISMISTLPERSRLRQVEADELRRLRDQRARDPGERRRYRVDDEAPALDRRADRVHAQDIFADAGQRAAERRMDEPPRRQPAEEQHDQGNRHRRCGRTGRSGRGRRSARPASLAARRRRRSTSSPCWPPRRGSRRRPGSASAGSARVVRRIDQARQQPDQRGGRAAAKSPVIGSPQPLAARIPAV